MEITPTLSSVAVLSGGASLPLPFSIHHALAASEAYKERKPCEFYIYIIIKRMNHLIPAKNSLF